MKIRWTKDSVRFRITPSELETLGRGEAVRESFPVGAGWNAAIVPSLEGTQLRFLDGEVQITLGGEDGVALLNPQNEGVYFQTEDDHAIRYFIEKDFPCAHPRAAEAMEPETETFAPPAGFDERKGQPRCD